MPRPAGVRSGLPDGKAGVSHLSAHQAHLSKSTKGNLPLVASLHEWQAPERSPGTNAVYLIECKTIKIPPSLGFVTIGL